MVMMLCKRKVVLFMEELFKGSVIFAYMFFCITMLSYDIFSSFQKITLIYLTNLGMTYTGILGAKYSVFLLIIMMYMYEEFLQTYDKDKNIVITNWIYKFCDFCYLCIFKNYIIWMFLSLIMVSNKIKSKYIDQIWICYGLSFLFFLICIHKLHGQKYKLETISKMFRNFNSNAYKKINIDNKNARTIFNLVVEIEDKSFFLRKNTFSWLSLEFMVYRIKKYINIRKNYRNGMKRKNKKGKRYYFRHPLILIEKGTKILFNKIKSLVKYLKKIKRVIRGYSTLEMQYIRTLGIISDKRKYVLRRKVYELLYTKIFFDSVKKYYYRNSYDKYDYFKEYLLYQYMQVTYTKINGIPFKTFMDAFENKNISEMDINSAVVAILGMNGNGIYPKRLDLYDNVFCKFDVDSNRVQELANKIGNREISKLP